MFNLAEANILLNQSFPDAQTAILEIGKQLVAKGKIEAAYVDSMCARQEQLSVHIGNYIAIPHGKENSQQWIKEEGITMVQVPDGVNFGTNEEPKIATILFFVYVTDEKLAALQEIAFLGVDIEQVMALSDAQTIEEVRILLNESH